MQILLAIVALIVIATLGGVVTAFLRDINIDNRLSDAIH